MAGLRTRGHRVGRSVRFLLLAFFGIYFVSLIAAGSGEPAISTKDGDIIKSVSRWKRESLSSGLDFPWVKVQSYGAFRCSGVLLDTAWILTTADCFNRDLRSGNFNVELLSNKNPVDSDATPSTTPSTSQSTIRTTSVSTSDSHDVISVHRVASFYIQGRYVIDQPRHNIAILKLDDNVTSPYTPADVIAERSVITNDDCLSLGWKPDGEGGSLIPSVQRWRVVDSSECSQRYHLRVPTDQLCALPRDDQQAACDVSAPSLTIHTGPIEAWTSFVDSSSCCWNGKLAYLTDGVYQCVLNTTVSSGDRGSPILCQEGSRWRVAGLISNNWRCSNQTEPEPALFLSVQHYLPFIQKRGHFKNIQSSG